MEVNNTGINLKNSKNNNINREIVKLLNEVVTAIQNILEHTFEVDNNSEYYKKILDISENIIYNLLLKNINLDKFKDEKIVDNLHLSTYLEGFEEEINLTLFDDIEYNLHINRDKIIGKLNKNFSMFFPIIINNIKDELKNHSCELNSKEGFKIIKKYIKKFLLIVFIYGEKVDFNLFKHLITNDIDYLYQKEKIFCNNASLLDKKEHSFNESLRESNKIKAFKDYYFFSSSYKYAFKKAEENLINYKNKNINIEKQEEDNLFNEFLSKFLESELKIAFEKLNQLFLKTIQLNVQLDIRLLKISNAFLKIFNYINFLAEKDIAFINLKYFNNNNNYINNLLTYLYNGKFVLDNNNNIFFCFLNDTFDRYLNKNYNFDEIKQLISHKKNNQTKLKYNNIKSDNGLNNYDIDKMNLDIWEKIEIEKRYEIFLTKIFQNSSKIKLNNILNIDSNNTNEIIKIFSTLYGDEINIIQNQINKINELIKKGISLENFIKYDVNNVLFLYQWLRLILFLKKFTYEPSIKNIEIYKENFSIKNVTLSNMIIKKLKEKELLDQKIDINPDGRLHNMSVENIGYNINGIFKSLAKGNIDIEKYKIGHLLFKDLKKLYNIGEDAIYEEIYNYIINGIDTLVDILHGKKIFADNKIKNDYVSLLKEYGIIKSLDKLSIIEKNNILKLIEGLKVVKGKLDILQKMLEVGNKDTTIIKNIFGNLIEKNDSKYSNFGEDKKFGRAFSKLIKGYNGDFHKIGDLTRLRITGKTYENVINSFIDFIQLAKNSGEIVNISLDDFTGHLFSFSKKSSGYRDLKTVFTLKSGNIVELQFHFEDMIDTKDGKKSISNEIKEKLMIENSLLDMNELIDFIKLYIDKNNKIPSIDLLENISNLSGDGIINNNDYKELINQNKSLNQVNEISGDILYYFRRNNSNKGLDKKLTRLERILFENTWSNIIIDYTKNNNIKIN